MRELDSIQKNYAFVRIVSKISINNYWKNKFSNRSTVTDIYIRQIGFKPLYNKFAHQGILSSFIYYIGKKIVVRIQIYKFVNCNQNSIT